MGFSRLPLLWRVFAINAGLVLLGVLAISMFSRKGFDASRIIHSPIGIVDSLDILIILAAMLGANLLLLQQTLAPIDRLVERMRKVDLLRPGQRLSEQGGSEVVEVVRAFNQMLDRLETERQESSRRALAAQEAERLRIAHGLHDEVSQVLTGVLLQLDALVDADPALRRRRAGELREAIRTALEEVRRIAQELRPELLEHLGLVSALTELARRFGDQSGVAIERRFAANLPRLSPEAEIAVYRIAQESLTNIARHAHARHVDLTLEPGAESIVLRVIDDGTGIDETAVPDGSGGLRGMRERALLVGGALAIKPGPGGGVEIRLEVPAQTP